MRLGVAGLGSELCLGLGRGWAQSLQVVTAHLMKWYVATSIRVMILFGHTKINEVWGGDLATKANKDVLWLNITMYIAI